ncbi:MAG: YihY/virulence factor BrkB family protein [Flavobacteriaceae bacterium]
MKCINFGKTTTVSNQWTHLPGVKQIIRLLRLLRIPGLKGFSMYALLELYLVGIVRGALTARAGSISFSFFMALFPFLLFVLNLIPFIPTVFSIDNFDLVLLDFIETLLPADTHGFFNEIFEDIQSKPRGGLLSSVFILSILLSANGVNAIFTSFEVSYHVKELRNIFKQYLFALGVSVLLAFLLLVAVISFIYFKLAMQDVLPETLNWVVWGQNTFFILLAYFSISILYYFGTIEGKLTHFFSPGALMTLLLFICSTYLFGIYIENFSNYNQLYGSIGALLIFMLYTWINSIVLLLGFELNATISRLKQENK